jgi:hypothetical protein
MIISSHEKAELAQEIFKSIFTEITKGESKKERMNG